MTGCVRFTEALRYLAAQGVEVFVEFGESMLTSFGRETLSRGGAPMGEFKWVAALGGQKSAADDARAFENALADLREWTAPKPAKRPAPASPRSPKSPKTPAPPPKPAYQRPAGRRYPVAPPMPVDAERDEDAPAVSPPGGGPELQDGARRRRGCRADMPRRRAAGDGASVATIRVRRTDARRTRAGDARRARALQDAAAAL